IRTPSEDKAHNFCEATSGDRGRQRERARAERAVPPALAAFGPPGVLRCRPRRMSDDRLSNPSPPSTPSSRSRRPNLAERTGERWRPPALEPPPEGIRRWTAAARRFFDLQAGSIWNDVAVELGAAR